MPDESPHDAQDAEARATAERDHQFAELAVKQGYVTQPQIEDALKAQKTIIGLGLKRSLSEILVEKGLLTGIQAETIDRTVDTDGNIKMVAGYELLEKLGEGGMGVVYRARQLSLDRIVALKILPEKLGRDREFAGRFMREARLAARLDHVNIVRALDVGEAQGVRYFAMEFVEGENIGSIIDREGRMPEARAIDIIIQTARALDHAHGHQLIHRDVKPDNILLTQGGVAKLADLGLARSTDEHTTRMTVTGTAMGTPHYISPEQARGEADIDIRTDIYSLGVTFFHMVTGTPPFQGSSAAIVITRRLTEEPPWARDVAPGVSEGTAQVVHKMMSREREDRYATPAELLRDLELVADGKKPTLVSAGAPAEPRGPLTLAGVHKKKLRGPEGDWWRGVNPLVWAGVAGAGVVALVLVVLVVVLATRQGGAPPGGAGPDGGTTPAVDVASSVRKALDGIDALAQKGELAGAIAAAQTAKSSYEHTKHAAAFAARLDELRRAQTKAELEAAAKERLETVRLLREAGKTDEAIAKAREGASRFGDTSAGPEIAKQLAELESSAKAGVQVAARLEAVKALEDAGALGEAIVLARKSARELVGAADVAPLVDAAERLEEKVKNLADERHAKAGEDELARLRVIAGTADGLDDALAAAKVAAKKYSSTTSAKALADLVAALEERVAGRDAAGAAERAKKLRAKRLLEKGKALLAAGSFAEAGDTFVEAMEIERSDEALGGIESARIGAHLAEAERKEKAGDLDSAVAEIRKALAIRDDAVARDRLRQLRGLVELNVTLARARELETKGDLPAAREAYRRILAGAPNGLKPELRKAIARVNSAIAFGAAITDARAAAAAGKWSETEAAATRALEAKPGDAEAVKLLDAAKAALAAAKLEPAAEKPVTFGPGPGTEAPGPGTETPRPGGEEPAAEPKPRVPSPTVKNSLGMELAHVPAGDYTVGDDGADPDERPARKVTLGAFYIGRTEVTNVQYEKFDRRHRRSAQYSPGDDHPVVDVSWHDAAKFARWLSRVEKATYRLPTEAEWEAAARGAEARPYPWGAGAPDAGGTFRANWGEGKDRVNWARDGFAGAAPAGSFPAGASPLGCADMAGNVWEWCADWYAPDYYAKGEAEDPTGPASGSEKCVRGGSFANDITFARSANRHRSAPNRTNPTIGFRVVMEAESAGGR